MPSRTTVTARTGPAIQNTAIILDNVTAIHYDLAKRSLLVEYVSPTQGPQTGSYDLSTVTTVTTSVSGSNFTVTIS